MAKIILALGDTVLREMALTKERVTIGRSPRNDIVIDNLAVSAEHAVIETLHSDSCFEDLNSTNGTKVNGQPVKKHFLQDNDVIELAQYRIRYVAHDDSDDRGDKNPASRSLPGTKDGATIRVLNGVNAGKETVLVKALTTIGHPGVQVAVITQRSHGYYITHVEGNNFPFVNGNSIGVGAYPIMDGDVIDLSGTQMQFAVN